MFEGLFLRLPNSFLVATWKRVGAHLLASDSFVHKHNQCRTQKEGSYLRVQEEDTDP